MPDWKGDFNPSRTSAVDAEGLPLLALSIRQPWLWAILKAGKRIENRKWKTSYRGPLLLHAAKGCTGREVEDFIEFVWGSFGAAAAGAMLATIPSLKGGKVFKRGGICGVATLRGMAMAASLIVSEKNRAQPPLPGMPVRIERPYVDGEVVVNESQRPWRMPPQHGWVLGDVADIPFVACSGALGLFRPEPSALALAHVELRRLAWKAAT